MRKMIQLLTILFFSISAYAEDMDSILLASAVSSNRTVIQAKVQAPPCLFNASFNKSKFDINLSLLETMNAVHVNKSFFSRSQNYTQIKMVSGRLYRVNETPGQIKKTLHACFSNPPSKAAVARKKAGKL